MLPFLHWTFATWQAPYFAGFCDDAKLTDAAEKLPQRQRSNAFTQ
jgi:hypothetical protein